MNAQAPVRARESGSDAITSEENVENLEYVPYAPESHYLRARMDGDIVYLLERENSEKSYEVGVRAGRLGSSESRSFSSFIDAYSYLAEDIMGGEETVERLLSDI